MLERKQSQLNVGEVKSKKYKRCLTITEYKYSTSLFFTFIHIKTNKFISGAQYEQYHTRFFPSFFDTLWNRLWSSFSWWDHLLVGGLILRITQFILFLFEGVLSIAHHQVTMLPFSSIRDTSGIDSGAVFQHHTVRNLMLRVEHRF